MAKPRSMRERRGWAFGRRRRRCSSRCCWLFTRHHWVDGDEDPRRGAVPSSPPTTSRTSTRSTFAHFVYDHGRLPRYLAKAELFDVPVAGAPHRGDGPDPGPADDRRRFTGVLRRRRGGPARASSVIVYPEGTLTRAPRAVADGRQDRRRTHRADRRGARSSRSPSGARRRSCGPTPSDRGCCRRKRVHAKVGDPVDLDDLRGLPVTPEVLREATDRIMDAITRAAGGPAWRAGAGGAVRPARSRGSVRSGNPHPHESRRT